MSSPPQVSIVRTPPLTGASDAAIVCDSCELTQGVASEGITKNNEPKASVVAAKKRATFGI